MAPNLVEINLRRLQLTNEDFEDLVFHLTSVKVLDISDCHYIESKGVIKFFEKCGNLLTRFEASNCQLAITDETLKALCNLENTTLTHLDIALAKLVTDEGLKHFENKTFPIEYLNINGLSAVTGNGLVYPILAV